jgi:hypothetical protein
MLCGSTLIVFMIKDPLIFVATSRLGEPVMALQRQLELLYCQVLLVVTTGDNVVAALPVCMRLYDS